MEALQSLTSCTAFAGMKRLAGGDFSAVVSTVKQAIDQGESATVLIFDDTTSQPIEVDFRGSLMDAMERLPKPSVLEDAPTSDADRPDTEVTRTPGRPKLGVVAREVTLLPRHWDWLNTQPGGASVTLRKLVESARRTSALKDQQRLAQEATHRFLSALAGNLPGYEEAMRALFAEAPEAFARQTANWPADVKDHAAKLALRAFTGPTV